MENFTMNDEIVLLETTYNDEEIVVKAYEPNKGEWVIWADTKDGEPYLDISTNLVGDDLLDAVWVERGTFASDIAIMLEESDKLGLNDCCVEYDYVTYHKYDILF
jgi:hypothetical protein